MPRPQLAHFAVTMPDGTVIPDVPEGTTQDELWSRYQTYLAQQKPATPIDAAVADREQAIAGFQAQKQQEYADRQAAIRAQEAANPDDPYGVPQYLREDRPAIDPYLTHRKPPLPESPVQKFGTAAKIGLVDDQMTQRKIMASSLFPNDPNGIDRVGFFDGTPVYVDDQGKMQQLTSGMTRFGASNLANLPETAGAIGGSLLGPWWGAPAGAMTAHAGKRYIASKIFDEPLDPLQLAKSTAIEGATTMAGDVPGRLGIRLYNRNRFIDMTPRDLKAAQAVQRRIKDTLDVDLDLAQASGNRRLIATRGFAARSPTKAADMFEAADEKAAAQFETATHNVLDRIANEKSADVAGRGAINAADDAIRSAKKQVSGLTEPDYKAAYAAAPVVTDPKVLRFFRLPYFKEAFRRGQIIARLEEKEAPTITVRTARPHPDAMGMNVREVPEMKVTDVTDRSPPASVKPTGVTGTPRPALTQDPAALAEPGTSLLPAGRPPGTSLAPIDEGGPLMMPGETPKFRREKVPGGFYKMKQEFTEDSMQVPDLRSLDYTKQGLDAVIDEMFNSGQGKLAGALSQQRKAFVAALDNLANPEYQLARAKYAKLYEKMVAPLENGPVGVLAKIKDPDAAGAAAKLFGDGDVSRAQIALTRRAIQAQNPGAWNDIVRSWLAQSLNRAKHETQRGIELNVPGKFRNQVFADPAQRARMEEMLPPDVQQMFGDLMEGAKRLGSTPVAGSVTRHDQAIEQMLKGTGANVFKWLTTWRRKVIDTAEAEALEKGSVSIADALLDPAKVGHLKRVMRMRPSTQRAILLSTIISAQQAPQAARAAFPGAPDSPPFAN